MSDKLTVMYDDTPDKVVDRVNKLLKEHGLHFQDDGEEHDGFCIYTLTNTKDK